MTETFGQFIKRNRLDSGLTLKGLSDLSGLSITFISRLERDDLSPPGEEKLKKLAHIFKMDEEDMIFKAERVPSNISQMMIDRPDIVPILRLGSKKTPEEVRALISKMYNE